MRTVEQADPPIVVGVEGSDPGLAATRWAAAEAALRGVPLHIVHSYGEAAATASVGGPECDAELIVGAAAAAARAEAPRLRVTRQTHHAPAAETLIELSHQASLVVVGHRGRGFSSPLRDLRSPVVSTVATHARGPVIVVRPDSPTRRGPVIVGVDGSPASDAALQFAFTEAAARRQPVHVIRACVSPKRAGECPPSGADQDAVDAALDAAERRLCESVQPWRDAYPRLPATVSIAPGHPFSALVHASRHASLLVVGACGGDGDSGRLGSVTQQLVHLAECPVAVVRPAPEPTARQPAAAAAHPARPDLAGPARPARPRPEPVRVPA